MVKREFYVLHTSCKFALNPVTFSIQTESHFACQTGWRELKVMLKEGLMQ